LFDQKVIWTSPLHLQPRDAVWLLPLGAATGVLIGSDHHTMTSLIRINANDQSHFNTLSDAGVVALGALPASMYFWSLFNDAPQAHETGLLTGEALADSLAVTGVARLIARRDRPAVNDAEGHFFSSGATESSFPSNHATAAWAMASVIGDEYPGWLTRTAVYGLAAGVSVSRVLADQHFPSDVLVGSATGWLIGHYIYRAHHNFRLNPFDPTPMPGEEGAPRTRKPQQTSMTFQPRVATHTPPRMFDEDADPDSMGSTNVPMDSWVYPTLERLAAMGLIPGQSVAIRPWTRQECLRQLAEAESLSGLQDSFGPGLVAEANRLMADLRNEFETEPNY
jgi:membrane-associated phospholipid phosphatase